LSEKFATAASAREYAERAEEYRGFLGRKTVAGLRAYAMVARADRRMSKLPGGLSRDELIEMVLDLSFPHLAEAISVCTGGKS
jgi:hypothetical protein